MVEVKEEEEVDCGIGLHLKNLGNKSIRGKFLMNDYPTTVVHIGYKLTLFFQNLEQYSNFANQLYSIKKKLEYQTKEKGSK